MPCDRGLLQRLVGHDSPLKRSRRVSAACRWTQLVHGCACSLCTSTSSAVLSLSRISHLARSPTASARSSARSSSGTASAATNTPAPVTMLLGCRSSRARINLRTQEILYARRSRSGADGGASAKVASSRCSMTSASATSQPGCGTEIRGSTQRSSTYVGGAAHSIASEKTPSKEARRAMPISAHRGRQVRHHQFPRRLLQRHPPQERDATRAADRQQVAVGFGLRGVARELAAGSVASDEQHGREDRRGALLQASERSRQNTDLRPRFSRSASHRPAQPRCNR